MIQKYLDRDANSGTHASSSATVTVPAGAQVVFAELSWLGTTQKDTNPHLQWDPNIWMSPMKMSVGDDQNYVSITPDQGTSIAPGSPASDTNDFYYSASANVTQYLARADRADHGVGRRCAIPGERFQSGRVGLEHRGGLPVPVRGSDRQPPARRQADHGPDRVRLSAERQARQPIRPSTVPAISDPDHVHVGLIAGEGDAGLTGDTFSINGHNIAHPVTGQTNNFFVSYAQNATNPNWTSNFSTDNVSWTLASGIVHAGDNERPADYHDQRAMAISWPERTRPSRYPLSA